MIKWLKDSFRNYRDWGNLNPLGKKQAKKFESAMAYSLIAGMLLGTFIMKAYFGVNIYGELLPEQKTFIGFMVTFWPVLASALIACIAGSYLYVFYLYKTEQLSREEALKLAFVSKAPESWF